MKKLTALGAIVLALAIPLFAKNYNIQTIPNGGCDNAINSSGQVVGNVYNQYDQAFIWSRTGGFQYLVGLSGNNGFAASAISGLGDVAGSVSYPGGKADAFFWTPSGGMVDIGSLLGGSASGWAVNDAGQVAGMTRSPDNYTQHLFFWSQATGAVDVGTLNGITDIYGNGFNNQGEIIGYAGPTAFLWTLSTGIQALATFGGTQGDALAINDNGQIVGSSTYADGTPRAALWAPDGTIHDLGTLPGDNSSIAQFINADGHVVGLSSYQSGKHATTRIFFWTPETGMIDTGATYPAFIASGLNNRDQILLDHYPRPAGAYLWSPSLALQKTAAGGLYLGQAYNDAGQYLAVPGHTCVLVTPVMHVTLGSSQNPSPAGQSVTFTANVSALVGLPPDGEQVTLYDGSKVLGSGLLSSGTASFATSTLKAGKHNISAAYAGDNNYDPNKSAKLLQVVQ